ncbi:MAG: AMP-binding protein [Gammaproteobacteria bacterium]|nr:AMP-binding protein [Gammaproteobacteria bacterium]
MIGSSTDALKDAPDERINEPLLTLVCQVAEELHPGLLKGFQPSLDSALDKDLGFDSLGRMELLSRVEQHFNIKLSDKVFITAETSGDLTAAILKASKSTSKFTSESRFTHKPVDKITTPDRAETLVDVLNWHVESQGECCHIFLYGDEDEPEQLTYAALADGAKRVAAGLRAHNLEPGDTVVIMLPTSRDYFFSFLGILLAGGIPVPIYPPFRLSQIEDHLRRHAKILANANPQMLITFPEAQKVALLLQSQVPEIRTVITAKSLSDHAPEQVLLTTKGSDIAFLQYTSGSTGNPKGVQLSHRNLLTNIRAMGRACEVDANDVFVSWLPLYHDMGLIGAWLGSLYFGFPLVLMSPLTFLAHPARWLWAIHKHKGTLSAAPNFAYQLCLHRVADEMIEGLDLSSWRLAFNGAEPVSPHTVRDFCQRFAQYGLRKEAMAPVYGLAESSVGLAFPTIGRVVPIDRVERESLTKNGRAEPADESDEHVLEFVACGHALDGHEIRIVDRFGTELPERHEGRLQFRGPSATRGYLRNPEATRQLFDGEWLESGDLAYQAADDIYVTSRIKDMIIHAGRNIYPHELEEAVGGVEGVRKGCVAVFGNLDPKNQTEKLVILAETRLTDQQAKENLHRQITAMTTELLGTPQDELCLAPPHTVLKTSSGKIRRSACKMLYEEDRLGEGQRAVWWQITRLAFSSAVPQLHRMGGQFLKYLYAGYAWSLFYLLAPLVWLLVATFSRSGWRWSVIRFGSRLLARMTGIGWTVEGLENLPRSDNYLIVANHSSYLDGIALAAILPVEPRFVAKAELRSGFISRVFLDRIDSRFVERFDLSRSLEDARRLSTETDGNHPMVFFPEGTFVRQSGLLPFHMGAFTIAAKAGMPVVPVVIRGTREILRANSKMIHRGNVSVTIEEAVSIDGNDWQAAITLKERVRAEMLKRLHEPDIS